MREKTLWPPLLLLALAGCAPPTPASTCGSASDCPAGYSCDTARGVCVSCRLEQAQGLQVGAVTVGDDRVDPGQEGVELRLTLTNSGACELRLLRVDAYFSRDEVDASADFRVHPALPGALIASHRDYQARLFLDVADGAAPGPVRVDLVASAVYPDGATVSATRTTSLEVAGLQTDPAALRFRLQPNGSYAGVPLSPQPQVEALDFRGELAVSAAAVRVEVAAGEVALGGTTEVALRDGLAVFTDLFVSGSSAHVVLRARLGQLFADSAAFAIAPGQPPPGACLAQDSAFVTAEGGCKDLLSGLVWSLMSPTDLIWDDGVWDSQRAGSTPPDAHDLGRTNDYTEPRDPSINGYDDTPTAYCHDRVEGGQLDWRAPSPAELLTLAGHLGAAAGLHLDLRATRVWSSSVSFSYAEAQAVDLGESAMVSLSGFTELPFLCVRGGRKPASRLQIDQAPQALGLGRPPATPLRASVVDPDGAPCNAEVLLTLAGPALEGTLEARADKAGRAELADWQLSEPGDFALELSAPGLSSARFHVRVGAFPGSCLVEDTQWQTAEGGCKQLRTGLVWSLPSASALSWDELVWDSQHPVDNVPADADDGGRSNDYGNDPMERFDASTFNYCHDKIEGGYTDWRAPSGDDLLNAWDDAQGAPVHLSRAESCFASSTTSATSDTHMVVCIGGQELRRVSIDKGLRDGHGICVRGGR